jgi:hypothetical protein
VLEAKCRAEQSVFTRNKRYGGAAKARVGSLVPNRKKTSMRNAKSVTQKQGEDEINERKTR